VTSCDSQPGCFCEASLEGDSFCGQNSRCADLMSCTSSADCDPGYFCSSNCCDQDFGFNTLCVPTCGQAVSSEVELSDETTTGIGSGPISEGPINEGPIGEGPIGEVSS